MSEKIITAEMIAASMIATAELYRGTHPAPAPVKVPR